MNYRGDTDFIDHINYGCNEDHRGYAYVYTIGCQMNSYDSEKIYAILSKIGYTRTDRTDKADIVVCNTCSIREKAQEKAYSFLGTVAGKKRKKPDLISIMAGCVAQQEGEKVFRRIPHLDIVMGTQAFSRLPGLIERAQSGEKNIADTDESSAIFESMPDFTTLDRGKVSRFVTIMQGCDNFCTYCVVPYVRGRERSRRPESIIQEIRELAESGVKEVTLLGQNVNSYGRKIMNGDLSSDLNGTLAGNNGGGCSFPELLSMVNEVDGIERIRFATSHPKDISDELIFAIRDLPKVCNQLHLPVQSGSDLILKKMNRGYTREKYLERIATLRANCPDVAISSDMIVGFPSETREDFELTLDLVRTVEFDGLFAFAYSDRPNAPAAKFHGALSEELKMERLNELLALQEHYTQKKNSALTGTIQSVLVEGRSLKNRHAGENGSVKADEESSDNSGIETESVKETVYRPQMTGRTETGKIVHFYGISDNSNEETKGAPEIIRPGQMVDIMIEQAYPHSLWGTVVRKTE